MRKLSLSLFASVALLGLARLAHADTIDLSTASLSGGVSLIANGTDLHFSPNQTGTATFTLASVAGAQYRISVTGQSDQSSSFFEFLVDANGPAPGGFVQLGSNVNFSPGFQTITLPTFTDLSTSDFLEIASGGTGNVGGHITGITITPVTVPGPILGAGLPGLVAGCGGLLALARPRRRKAT
jgi:hypothetical protein